VSCPAILDPSISFQLILGATTGDVLTAGCNSLQEVACALTANVCDSIRMDHKETG
jgi:hypothetical protein